MADARASRQEVLHVPSNARRPRFPCALRSASMLAGLDLCGCSLVAIHVPPPPEGAPTTRH